MMDGDLVQPERASVRRGRGRWMRVFGTGLVAARAVLLAGAPLVASGATAVAVPSGGGGPQLTGTLQVVADALTAPPPICEPIPAP